MIIVELNSETERALYIEPNGPQTRSILDDFSLCLSDYVNCLLGSVA